MGAFFGCRPCSLFDTRVKLQENEDLDDTKGHSTLAGGENLKERAVVKAAFDRERGGPRQQPDAEVNPTARRPRSRSIVKDSEDEEDTPMDASEVDDDTDVLLDESYSDEISIDDESGDTGDDAEDSGVDTDDDCYAGPEATRSFLYRHMALFILPNEEPGMPNSVLMKASLLHTKGEDNNPRV